MSSSPRPRSGALLAAVAILSLFATPALAQLRVAAWNISNYGGGRLADIRNVVYGIFIDNSESPPVARQLAPDVILLQEILSASGLNDFVLALNTAPGSPGDWAAAPFVDGADTESAFVYRTTRVVLLPSPAASFVPFYNPFVTTIGVGSSASNNQPRNTYRYDIRPVGYSSAESAIGCYSVHMKAGSASTDQARRLVESQRIRDNAEGVDTNGTGTGLPAGFRFLVGGDFNIQSSNQAAYQELVAAQVNNSGRFFDPIKTPGSWNNNSLFRFVHTQDPIGAGGMDDRHDQILLGGTLIDGVGLTYIGNPDIAYSTTTWNDPNHSYRAWGNDGTSFDVAMRTTGNTMVGASIAQSIINCAAGAGHIPVFLDLRVPAKVDATISIDFGHVTQNDPASGTFYVLNSGDTAMWTEQGISNLNYSLSATSGITVPAGPFSDAAGGASNTHTVQIDTSSLGTLSGFITIASDDPDQPIRTISIVAEIVTGTPPCLGDWNGDTVVNSADVTAFFSDWFADLTNGTLVTNVNGDGTVNSADVTEFLSAWFFALANGC